MDNMIDFHDKSVYELPETLSMTFSRAAAVAVALPIAINLILNLLGA